MTFDLFTFLEWFNSYTVRNTSETPRELDYDAQPRDGYHNWSVVPPSGQNDF
jgi:hypothetical protein